MLHKPNKWYQANVPMPEFVVDMLAMGQMVESLLVGAFFDEGRGAQRDIELDFHHDGVYSQRVAEQQGSEYVVGDVDYVGFYCVRGGDAVTVLRDVETGVVHRVCLKTGDVLVVNNKRMQHAREGAVGDRVLFRMWIKDHQS